MNIDRRLQLEAKTALSDVLGLEAFIETLGSAQRPGKQTAMRLMLKALNEEYGLAYTAESNDRGEDVYMVSLEDLKKAATKLKGLVYGKTNQNLQEVATILNEIDDTFAKKSWLEEKRFKHEFMAFDGELARYYKWEDEPVDNVLDAVKKDLGTVKTLFGKMEDAIEDYADAVEEARKEIKDAKKGEELEDIAEKLVNGWPKAPAEELDDSIELLGYKESFSIDGEDSFKFPDSDLRSDNDGVSLKPLHEDDLKDALSLIEDLSDLLADIQGGELEFLKNMQVHEGFQWEDKSGPVHELDKRLNADKVWLVTTDGLSWLGQHVEALIRVTYDYMRESVK